MTCLWQCAEVWLCASRRTAGGFFANYATVMLTQLVAQSFGLLIGATVMIPKTAQTITSVTMLGMMLVRGCFSAWAAPSA